MKCYHVWEPEALKSREWQIYFKTHTNVLVFNKMCGSGKVSLK